MVETIKDTDPLELLEAQIRENFGRVVYSHKAHEKCADISLTWLKRTNIALIVLSAITSGSLILSIFGDSKYGVVFGALCSTALLGLTLYIKDYNLGEIAQKHREVANELWDIRETYLSILTDIRGKTISVDEVKSMRDKLQVRLKNTYFSAPRTNNKAYEQARNALKSCEEMTFSIEEINAFMPDRLRKNSP